MEYCDSKIDLDKIVRSKTDKIPQFVINWLKKFIHQDFLNDCFSKGYKGKEFLDYAVEFLDVVPVVKGIESLNLDPGHKYTFVSNHPLGGIDGLIVGSTIYKLLPQGSKLSIQVNDFLMAVPGLRDSFIPINKMGAQSRSLPQQIEEQYSSPDPMLVFPAGLCSRKIDGKVQDLEWKKTFITKSIKHSRTIVPIHFIGENSKRFYRIARLCKFLKLKFNFAMLYLPDEMYKGQHKTFQVIFGTPIDPSVFDSSKTPLQWAAWVRDKVYSLN